MQNEPRYQPSTVIRTPSFTSLEKLNPFTNRVGELSIFLLFVAVGLAISVTPTVAPVMLGLVLAVVVCARKALLTTIVVALTLVPGSTIFSGSPAEFSTAAIVHQIETGGDLPRIIAILLLFAIGLTCMLIKGPRELRRVNLFPWIGMYLALAVTSVLWSQDVSLTLRRFTSFFAIIVFALGIGTLYYGQRPKGHIHLIQTICWGSLAVSLATLTLAILRGNFHLFDLAWRLGSNGRENQISWVAAIGFLGAWVTKNRADIWPGKVSFFLTTSISALVLLLTKSRTTLLAVVVGIFMAEAFKQRSWTRRLVIFIFTLSTLMMFILTPLKELWSRGESEEQLQSASGRTDLWERLWPEVQKRLWLGYGFGAFWSPQTVSAVAKDWTPTSAHNGYLEGAAELGVTGLLLLLVFIGVSSRNAWRLMQYREYREIGLTLLVWLSMSLVINATESFLQSIDYYPMMAILVFSFFVAYRLHMLREFEPTIGSISKLPA